MKKNKILSLFLALMMICAVLPGCGDGSGSGTEGSNGLQAERKANNEIVAAIAEDLKGILRDIRNEHRPDTMTADETSLVATVQGQLQDAMNFEGSVEEKKIRAYLATIGLDYDALTKEEFVSLIGILKKSKLLRTPINQRGKNKPYRKRKK